MTSEEAWKELRDLRNDGKKKFTERQKRSLEYAMVMIAQRVGEEVLSGKRGYANEATMHIPVSEKPHG